MPKTLRAFRLNPELYSQFRDLASKGGYTATGAIEKFMSSCVENGVLTFPSSVAAEDVEAEARIMLAWLKKDQHWYSPESGQEEFSVEGRLLQLLPRVQDRALKEKIEGSLKTV